MKRILFVEDDTVIARVYTQKLSEAGFDVTWAEDGLVAMKRLMESAPDLVVLDLMLPKFSGVDVLKFMRRNASLKATRVIIFSSSFLGGLIEQVGTAGVERVLVKSSSTPQELITAIQEVFDGVVRPPVAQPPTAPASAAAASALAAPGGSPVESAGGFQAVDLAAFPGAFPGSAPSAPVAAPTPAPIVSPPAATPLAPTPIAPALAAAPAIPVAAPAEVRPEVRARARVDFLKNGGAAIAGVRDLCLSFVEAAEAAEQVARLQDLHRKTRFLTQMAVKAEFQRIGRLAAAFEGLVFELQEKPRFITDSVRHTIVGTVTQLAQMFDQVGEHEEPMPAHPRVLVVDDDAVSNRALVFALNRLQLRPESLTDPLEALKRLGEQPYDLVLLDVSMPGMDGLTLCERLRALPAHRFTPVVFVTSHSDFKTRARSQLSGGNDFITKPILPVELCVKAITHLLAARPARPDETLEGYPAV